MRIECSVRHQQPLYKRVMPIFLMFLVSCSTTKIDSFKIDSSKSVFDQAVRVEPTQTLAHLDIEDPGKIIITHGSACGESNQSGKQNIVQLPGIFTLPAYANAATVFLNGWHLRYLAGDEHIRALMAAIDDIELSGGELSWSAYGELSDMDFKDGFEFCYYYTVMAWNDSLIDALPDHDNENWNRYSWDGTKPLGERSSYIENEEFEDKNSVAILPRGFMFSWPNETWIDITRWPITCSDCAIDRDLLQMAFNMDHSEAFVKQGENYERLPAPAGSEDANRFDPAIRTWKTYSILKNDDSKNNYLFNELFSAVGGNDIGVIEPPFAILPRDPLGFFEGCITTSPIKTEDVEIRDIPFDYAVPVLTGWELGFHCGHQHVKSIGIRLEEIEYEKDPAEATGILRYKMISELRDDENNPGVVSSHKVTILGLNGREPADLVPQDNSAVQFCNTDPQGRLLVSVANIGTDDAPASTTSIDFGGGVLVEVATPPIPANFTVTLDPVNMQSCEGDCSFSIRVDSKLEVTETNEVNNITDGKCVG